MAWQHWRFWADRGGTFTDVVARSPDGRLHRMKLMSEDPGRYDDAVVEAMRRLTGVRDGPLPRAHLRLGTTVATNALLERRGEPVLLAITRGFGDALRIGTQERPDIFARRIVLPEPLYAEVAEIDERVSANGEVLCALDEDGARAALRGAYDRGLRAIAIVLMHGYRFGTHEAALAMIAREIGFTQVSASHAVAPLIPLIARGDTTVADAYLSPVLRRYLTGLDTELGPAVGALYMKSDGGLAAAEAFHGKDAVLSGPAGGVIGMVAVAREAGFSEVVGFDMGGTSTDVSHYAGSYERDGDTRIAGVRIRAPMMRIATVAAGGGSICRLDGARFLVGPQSAGAVPGPASYRRGGPLTLTDCNLLLGKLQPAHFPAVFGPDAEEPLDPAAAEARMDAVLADMEQATGRRMSRAAAAEGFVAIATASMANAIKQVSLRRGHDVTRAALVCFGGAAGQHACLVANALGIDEVLCHPLASVLSAYGIGLAERAALREITLAVPLDGHVGAAIAAEAARLEAAARVELTAQGITPDTIGAVCTLAIRPEGSDATTEVPLADTATTAETFGAGWIARFGFAAARGRR